MKVPRVTDKNSATDRFRCEFIRDSVRGLCTTITKSENEMLKREQIPDHSPESWQHSFLVIIDDFACVQLQLANRNSADFSSIHSCDTMRTSSFR